MQTDIVYGNTLVIINTLTEDPANTQREVQSCFLTNQQVIVTVRVIVAIIYSDKNVMHREGNAEGTVVFS